ncbi:hypothetical protein [uncultured Gammaproteobacteria bacterium]|nr:hypothetical protein [uncultured Gammaproteobacteria bacterium]
MDSKVNESQNKGLQDLGTSTITTNYYKNIGLFSCYDIFIF